MKSLLTSKQRSRLAILLPALTIPLIVILSTVFNLPSRITSFVSAHTASQNIEPLPVAAAPAADAAQMALRDAVDRAVQAKTYRYTSDVEQTMIPRAVPGMIGQQDQKMMLAIEGEILGPDKSRTTLQYDPGQVSGIPNLLPVTIVREGTTLYAERSGKRQSFQNETLTATPTDNVLDYLAVAENVKTLESKTVNGVTYSRIGFDIRGDKMAQQQVDRIKRVHPTAIVNLPETLKNATGSGELWIGPNGLPARQIINMELPQVSREYHARLQMRTNFAEFSGVSDAPVGNPATVALQRTCANSAQHKSIGQLVRRRSRQRHRPTDSVAGAVRVFA